MYRYANDRSLRIAAPTYLWTDDGEVREEVETLQEEEFIQGPMVKAACPEKTFLFVQARLGVVKFPPLPLPPLPLLLVLAGLG